MTNSQVPVESCAIYVPFLTRRVLRWFRWYLIHDLSVIHLDLFDSPKPSLTYLGKSLDRRLDEGRWER